MEVSSVKKIWHLPDFFISICYMKIYSYLFSFIISCFFVSGSFAERFYGPGNIYTAHFNQSLAVCTSQGSGECLNGEICGYGGSNTTCIGAICEQCSERPGDGYDYSDPGAHNREGCFKYCVPEDVIVDGEKAGQKEPSVLSVCYPSSCPANDLIYCKNESDECNGYHAENGTCVPNKQECTGDHGTGYKFWECDEDGNNCKWSECRLTQCDNNYHLEPMEIDPDGNKEYGFICNTDTIYGKCVSNTVECASMLGDCKNANGDGGSIKGDAVWTTEGHEIDYAPGKWDFSKCSCTTSNESIGGGIGGKECFYTSSGAWGNSPVVWNTNCEVTEVASCDVGYCQPNETTGCTKAPAGYYHDNSSSFACQPCPIGATSAVGATGIDRCFMQTGNTEFCDSVGCFKLPSNVPY